jgi:hypothetical protein
MTESSGHWKAGVKAKLPGLTATDPGTLLTSVSCASPGNCSAVGYYFDASVYQQGVLLTETSGKWGPGVKVTLPKNGATSTSPNVNLNAVSCPSVGSCSTVGYYSDNSHREFGLVLNESLGKWHSGAEAHAPADVSTTDPSVSLNAVSCGSKGNCSAVGYYADTSGYHQGILLTEKSGTWGPGMKAALPADAPTAASPNANLQSVSCASAGNCSAVGQYFNSVSYEGVLMTESSGKWKMGVKAKLPVDASSNPGVFLISVSCRSAGNCSAVGYYNNTAGQQGLLLTEASSGWEKGVKMSPPADAESEPAVQPYEVSCPALGNCTAVGSYYGPGNEQEAFRVSMAPAHPVLSVSAPKTGTTGHEIASSSLAALLKNGSAPTGVITFTVFGPSSVPPSHCTTGGKKIGTAKVGGNATYHPSQGFTPANSGRYWWYASYSGDWSDNSAVSPCGSSMPNTMVP